MGWPMEARRRLYDLPRGSTVRGAWMTTGIWAHGGGGGRKGGEGRARGGAGATRTRGRGAAPPSSLRAQRLTGRYT